jgi:flagellar biosynthesis component FlhA
VKHDPETYEGIIDGLREHPAYIILAAALLLFLVVVAGAAALAIHDLSLWLMGGM